MGKPSRDKGQRTERSVVHLLQECGLAAERIPLSGSAGGSFSGDITCPGFGKDHRLEVKCRANGFKEIYGWLEGVDGLVLKADRKPLLLVIPLTYAARHIAEAETLISSLREKR